MGEHSQNPQDSQIGEQDLMEYFRQCESSRKNLSNPPTIVKEKIAEYLDIESLINLHTACPEWNIIPDDHAEWESRCIKEDIPKCWYFEHYGRRPESQSSQCFDSTHTWRRAYINEDTHKSKWINGRIKIVELEGEYKRVPLIRIWGEWIFMHFDYPDIKCWNTLTNESRLTVLPKGAASNGFLDAFILEGFQFPWQRRVKGHDGAIACLTVSKVPENLKKSDNRCLLVSSGEDKKIILWKLPTFQKIWIYTGFRPPISLMEMVHNVITIANATGTVYSLDNIRKSLTYLQKDAECIYCNGKFIISSRDDKNYRVFEANHYALDYFEMYKNTNVLFVDKARDTLISDCGSDLVYRNYDKDQFQTLRICEGERPVAFQKFKRFQIVLTTSGGLYLLDESSGESFVKIGQIPPMEFCNAELHVTDSEQRVVCCVSAYETYRLSPVTTKFYLISPA